MNTYVSSHLDPAIDISLYMFYYIFVHICTAVHSLFFMYFKEKCGDICTLPPRYQNVCIVKLSSLFNFSNTYSELHTFWVCTLWLWQMCAPVSLGCRALPSHPPTSPPSRDKYSSGLSPLTFDLPILEPRADAVIQHVFFRGSLLPLSMFWDSATLHVHAG